MLDYSLYGNNEEFVSLKDEIAYIENLIALFKLKDDEITNIVFDYKNTNTQSKIAPMLLLPFVENAFKHGNIEDIENGNIGIELSSTNHKNIDFKCYNTFSTNKKIDKIGGIGIVNVKRRLELLYPNNYMLTIENNEHQYKVHLKIQHNA
jgi:LytS/YehU family sensor histidine kinase